MDKDFGGKGMTHGSLFSGIGGFDYAASMMGWRNAFQCEINGFCMTVLKYHFPNAEHYADITKTDFTKWRGTIDVLSGGFPCQPFSCAGRRKGADDDRYLWPEMLRAIHEIRPSWVVGENVAGILSMVQPGEEVEMGSETSIFGEDNRKRVLLRQEYVIETVCRDLERKGYSVRPFVIPACAVGAPHRRDRVWIVARLVADTDRDRQRHGQGEQEPVTERERTPDDCACSQDGIAAYPDEHGHTPRWEGEGTESGGRRHVPQPCERGDEAERPDGLPRLQRPAADTRSDGRPACELHDGEPEKPQQAGYRAQQPLGTDCPQGWWRRFPTQPPVCSRDDGVSTELDGITFSKWRQEAIKAYGNAIVPQVAYEIFKAIQSTY